MPLLLDGNIATGWVRERRLIKRFLRLEYHVTPTSREVTFEMRIPKLAYEYAKGISEFTGLPLETVLKSKPVRSYIKRLREEVVVRL